MTTHPLLIEETLMTYQPDPALEIGIPVEYDEAVAR